MREPVKIVLGGEPVGKGRPRFVRSSGVAYTPARTRSYERALRYAAQEAMGEAPPMDGPLWVTMAAIFPVPKSWSRKKRDEANRGLIWATVRPDADNLLKNLDSLNGVVWNDDKQIVDARVVKRYGDRPRIVIEVHEFALPLEQQEAA